MIEWDESIEIQKVLMEFFTPGNVEGNTPDAPNHSRPNKSNMQKKCLIVRKKRQAVSLHYLVWIELLFGVPSSGPQFLDRTLSEISAGHYAAFFAIGLAQYTASGVCRFKDW